MNVKCKETVKSYFGDILFTKDKIYDFVYVDNRYTRFQMGEFNFVGYIKKDDEKFKRWISKEFKEIYFEDVNIEN